MEEFVSWLLLALRIALALALYAFLGWALATLWANLKQEGQAGTRRPMPSITLKFSREDMPGELHLTQPQAIIGRDPASDCVINHRTVSARHARLSYHHNQWWLDDLDSTNGTFLNDQPLSKEVVLADYDQVRCGEVGFIVLISN